jgi:serine/threonine protein kinase
MPLSKGQTLINRYRIVSLLGKGGFGAVYRAWDVNLGKPCAVKENLDVTENAQRQFQREATILAGLSHPNLPRVTDHFTIENQGQYLVMDFVEGEDLQSMVDRTGRPLPEDQAVDWILQICDALTYLHSQQPPIIHRDIKPANIRITPEGRAMLVDFGIAKIFDPHLRTTIGARAVTPGYSPFEQYGQGTTDRRSDVYALGATLYTLLTGKELPESIQRISSDRISPPRQTNPVISPNLDAVIMKSVALHPNDRFQRIDLFKSALTADPTVVVPPPIKAQTYTQAGAPPISVPTQIPTQKKDRRAWWGLAVVVGIITIAAIIFWPGGNNGSTDVPGTERAVNATLTSIAADEDLEPTATDTITMPEEPESQPQITEVVVVPPTEIPTEPSLPPTDTRIPPTEPPQDPYFTANQNMFCRQSWNSESEAHYTVTSGQTWPVLAKASNGWLLLGIDHPSTRTKCCWVSGEGSLNVSASSIQTINYEPDRLSCNVR